jgi:hypothetical protein
LSARPTRASSALRALARLGLALAAHRAQRLHHVAERGHVREQVELLEHHADALAHARQLGLVVAAPAGIGLARRGAADRLARELDDAGARPLHEVEAAQQRALARARGAEDGDAVAGHDVEVDAAQHGVVAEVLLQPRTRSSGSGRHASDRPSRRSSAYVACTSGKRHRKKTTAITV